MGVRRLRAGGGRARPRRDRALPGALRRDRGARRAGHGRDPPHDRHFDLEFVWRLATHPRVLDTVEAVIGSDLLLLSSHFFNKYPAEERGERFVAWHQDVTYWGLEPPLAVSGWLAIDDADETNGCMRVIPGSHRLGILRPPDRFGDDRHSVTII